MTRFQLAEFAPRDAAGDDTLEQAKAPIDDLPPPELRQVRGPL